MSIAEIEGRLVEGEPAKELATERKDAVPLLAQCLSAGTAIGDRLGQQNVDRACAGDAGQMCGHVVEEMVQCDNGVHRGGKLIGGSFSVGGSSALEDFGKHLSGEKSGFVKIREPSGRSNYGQSEQALSVVCGVVRFGRISFVLAM